MLKIELRPGQSVRIGDAVVTVEEKSGQIVRLSCEADRSVPIEKIGAAEALKARQTRATTT